MQSRTAPICWFVERYPVAVRRALAILNATVRSERRTLELAMFDYRPRFHDSSRVPGGGSDGLQRLCRSTGSCPFNPKLNRVIVSAANDPRRPPPNRAVYRLSGGCTPFDFREGVA